MKPRCNKKYFSLTSGLLHIFYDRYLTPERLEKTREVLRAKEEWKPGSSHGKGKRKAGLLGTFDSLEEFETQRRACNPFTPVVAPIAICNVEVSTIDFNTHGTHALTCRLYGLLFYWH